MTRVHGLIHLFIVFLASCGNAVETSADSGPSKPVDELTTEYFAGEWCLVRSTKDGADATPNLNFRFSGAKRVAFESAAGSGKFRPGSYSWKPDANLFLLSTPPTLMRTAKIEKATENGFVLGGKIGYTFRRGVCGD